MQTITLEPLRWLERPSRVTIVGDNGDRRAYFQITSPRDIARMAIGRPAEELPRILGMLSPAHHLVSAMALDRLFKVEPPDPAVNMREALLQAQFICHHLRKLYFFAATLAGPFRQYRMRAASETGSLIPDRTLDEIMDCLALAQEAATILGGRADHPLSVVPGGMSRALKEPHYPRLSEISARCTEFVVILAKLFRERVFGGSRVMDDLVQLRFHPMASLTSGNGNANLILRDYEGKEAEKIPPDRVFEKVGFHREAWSYEPFAFLKDRSWSGYEPENSDSLYFVGPLARLNTGSQLPHPLAEEERRSLIDSLGPLPHFSVGAAYWSLIVELIDAAERLVELASQDKLMGPAIRSMSSETGDIGYATLESPQGLISHRYKTDERAIVQDIEVLDTSTQNNALLCCLVRTAAEDPLSRNARVEDTKSRIEISLLPF